MKAGVDMGWRGILIAIVAFPLCLRGELLAIRTYTTADGNPNNSGHCVVNAGSACTHASDANTPCAKHIFVAREILQK